uniref:Uncharacterized protein n=1 Tax=Anguilla anguilla TaxID=7936 RepID=A0A0E9QQ99_ANGAN
MASMMSQGSDPISIFAATVAGDPAIQCNNAINTHINYTVNDKQN